MAEEKLSNMGLHPAPVYALVAFLKKVGVYQK
jgi:hypothetical protein